MGRPAKHRISRDHPSPRFRGKVRLSTQVHGPDDTRWYAQFWIDQKWKPPFNPVSLHTRDFDEACEVARDRFTLVASGEPITIGRKPSTPTNTFGMFAQQAIAKLTQQAIEADLVAKGKGRNFTTIALRITGTLLPRWADTPIADITEDDLNDWVRDTYRVRVRVKDQPDTYKAPSMSTLGNVDWAFRKVWDEAVGAKVVDRRKRPTIDQENGTEGENRPFIDHAGVQALKDLMTDAWIEAGGLTRGASDRAHRRLLRDYIAIASSTGIRAGLELERVTLGSVVVMSKAIVIRVAAHQGKHGEARSVVVFEGGIFQVRHLLSDLLARRKAEGAGANDPLFAYADGTLPEFPVGLKFALKEAECLTDPDTKRERVGYSFRHYFATLLIERGLSVMQVADWLGTGTKMVEKHYNRYLTERNAHLLNGYQPATVRLDKHEAFGDREMAEEEMKGLVD